MDSTLNLFILALVGFLAGVINIVAGGGSLLTLPMLIFLGLPSNVANATNRVGIFIQNVFAIKAFHSKGVSDFKFGFHLAIPATLGAIVGAYIAVDIPDDVFNKILAGIMVLIVVYMLFKPKLDPQQWQERKTGKSFWVSMLVFFGIGFYGGAIQAGVGFLMIMAMTGVNKFSLIKTNALKLFVTLIYSIPVLYIFIKNGLVNWKYGLILAAGNALGAWLMSRYAVKKGDGFVRILLIVIVSILAVVLWFYKG
ncbi:sulfite exporter TauE/SafE family protein [Flavobacteriaceae bacterium F08102]|nr:sulfite exporter TauE/SafE family protein [Flavobacteriaceae bacterium F08102]